jgi:hypothetical protein
MKEYLLIFRHPDGAKVASPEQMQKWMQQTMDWLGGLAKTGNFEGKGNGLLFSESRVVHHDKSVTDGPFGEIKETLGGYVIVKANTADEAAEFAKGSPVLQGEGNTVEVRLISNNGKEAMESIQ